MPTKRRNYVAELATLKAKIQEEIDNLPHNICSDGRRRFGQALQVHTPPTPRTFQFTCDGVGVNGEDLEDPYLARSYTDWNDWPLDDIKRQLGYAFTSAESDDYSRITELTEIRTPAAKKVKSDKTPKQAYDEFCEHVKRTVMEYESPSATDALKARFLTDIGFEEFRPEPVTITIELPAGASVMSPDMGRIQAGIRHFTTGAENATFALTEDDGKTVIKPQ